MQQIKDELKIKLEEQANLLNRVQNSDQCNQIVVQHSVDIINVS